MKFVSIVLSIFAAFSYAFSAVAADTQSPPAQSNQAATPATHHDKDGDGYGEGHRHGKGRHHHDENGDHDGDHDGGKDKDSKDKHGEDKDD